MIPDTLLIGEDDPLLPPTGLAIEDDPEVFGIIWAHLTGAGYRVRVAAEGEAGLELARTHPVDLITLDLVMSPVDGHEVLHRLRADVATRHMPVVLVTVADELTDDTVAEGFVSKPFLGRRLLAEVRRLVPLSGPRIRHRTRVRGRTRRRAAGTLSKSTRSEHRSRRPLSAGRSYCQEGNPPRPHRGRTPRGAPLVPGLGG